MKLKTKFKILLWSLIFLVLLNVSTILIVIYKSKDINNIQNITPKENNNLNQPFPNRKNSPKQGMFTNFLINELDMDNNQKQEFIEIRKNFLEQSHFYFDSIKYYSDIIDSKLDSDNPNYNQIEKYTKKIGNYHTKLKLNFVNYYFNIRKMLNKEQKDKLFKVFMEFKKQKRFHNPKNKQGPNNGRRNKRPRNKFK